MACDVYVVKVNDREWHVRCQESGCNYGRWFGQSEGLARRANGKHATAHDHIGGVAYDKVTLDGAGTVYHYPSVSGRRKSSPKQPRKLVKLVPETVPPPF